MQQKEYAQIYEMGLGSLIGDFFQNVKDTVTGVARAVAPIAPFVLPFLPGGPITKQLIGAGIGLAAGQKPVDIAKNMALQAATSGIASSLSGGRFGQSFGEQLESIGLGRSPAQVNTSNLSQALNFESMPSNVAGNMSNLPSSTQAINYTASQPVDFQVNTPPIDYVTPEKGFFENLGDKFMATFDPSQRTINPEYKKFKLFNPNLTDAQLAAMGVPKEAGFTYQYGPSLYAGLQGLSLADRFINPPEEDTGTGYDEAERERFTFPYANPLRAADGGEVTGGVAGNGRRIEHPDGKVKEHPKRIGEIVGPGTGTSDDIPAMLSDGEFVMTAQAVRNAGGGSRKQGAKNMYKMMKNLEKGGTLSQQSIGMA
tara:strand:+ start:494 stop:1603 length:1110 start_codon:yes stop_codon:yes gene_type:complete